MSERECHHGSLRRSCEICERDERIEQLEAAGRRLLAALDEVHAILFGDSCAAHRAALAAGKETG